MPPERDTHFGSPSFIEGLLERDREYGYLEEGLTSDVVRVKRVLAYGGAGTWHSTATFVAELEDGGERVLKVSYMYDYGDRDTPPTEEWEFDYARDAEQVG